MITDPFSIPRAYALRLKKMGVGFYGTRPLTWGEWRSATFYTDRLVIK